MKLLRQRQKTITIEKDQNTTRFIIHDINFENIDDWDLFNQDSSNSINDEPLNPTFAEQSIREIIMARKQSLAKRLNLVQKNPLSEHRGSSHTTISNPVKLKIKSNVISHCMEKF